MAFPQVVTRVKTERPAAVEQIRILTWAGFGSRNVLGALTVFFAAALGLLSALLLGLGGLIVSRLVRGGVCSLMRR